MTGPDKDERLRRALEAHAAEERRRLGEPPGIEQVLALLEGRLEGAERERIADAVASFPELARLAADLADFEAPTDDETARPAGEGDPPVWPALRDRLAAEGWPGASEAAGGSSYGAPSSPARRSGGVPWWAAAAAALVAALAGLWAGSELVRERPRPNPVVATLLPADAPTERSGESAPPLTVPPDTSHVVLVLAFAGGGEAAHYRLDLTDDSGTTIWSTDRLRPRETGDFTLEIPGRFLEPGRYRLELRAAGAGSGTAPMTVWELRLTSSPETPPGPDGP